MRAQFLILVGDLCVGAGLAGLEVELETADGVLRSGVPAMSGARQGDDEIDDTGYASSFRVAGDAMALESIVACRVRSPA